MAVVIRLARYGAKKKPFYRVVAADRRFARDGRFLEILGTYDPRNKDNGIKLKVDAIRQWATKGAQLTHTVRKLMKQSVRSATAPE
ncbi:30S ribosomal protein S16 [Thermodesulfobacteriota bacterium]